MWTKEHREAHKQSGNGFPSDLTDAQWARLEPLVPAAKTGGRPAQTGMRAAMNAIFYLLRTGCPWRYLPRDPFPARSTVYNIFRKFQREGALLQTSIPADFRYDRLRPGWGGYRNGSRQLVQGAPVHSGGDPVGRSVVSYVSHQLPRSRTDAPRPRRRGRPHNDLPLDPGPCRGT